MGPENRQVSVNRPRERRQMQIKAFHICSRAKAEAKPGRRAVCQIDQANRVSERRQRQSPKGKQRLHTEANTMSKAVHR